MTLRAKYPLTYYLESNKRMLGYRNVRRRAEERACAREAREKRSSQEIRPPKTGYFGHCRR
jgi:hypothetical protein